MYVKKITIIFFVFVGLAIALTPHTQAYITNLNCDSFPGFIPVPGDAVLNTKNFCVMQFEAKAFKDSNENMQVDAKEIRKNGCNGKNPYCINGTHNWGLEDHIAVSVPQGKPWRLINRNNAISKCQELNDVYSISKDSGIEFDLISNDEWQSIARNIEMQNENWSGKKVGQGCLKQGNSGTKNKMCGYNSGDSPERGARKKARHILSNKEYIYHFAGNVWEWVKGNNPFKQSKNRYIYKLSGQKKYHYGPQGDYDDDSCNKSNNYCGLGYGYFGSGDAILRGGSWWWDLNRTTLHDAGSAGVFATGLDHGPMMSSSIFFGFRCVLRSTLASNASSDDYE